MPDPIDLSTPMATSPVYIPDGGGHGYMYVILRNTYSNPVTITGMELHSPAGQTKVFQVGSGPYSGMYEVGKTYSSTLLFQNYPPEQNFRLGPVPFLQAAIDAGLTLAPGQKWGGCLGRVGAMGPGLTLDGIRSATDWGADAKIKLTLSLSGATDDTVTIEFPVNKDVGGTAGILRFDPGVMPGSEAWFKAIDPEWKPSPQS